MSHQSSHSPIADSTLTTIGKPTFAKPAKSLATLGLAAVLAAASSFALVPSAAASCVTAPSGLSAWWKLDTVNFGVSTPEIIASNHATLFGSPLTNVLGYVDKSVYLNPNTDYLVAPDCRTADIGTGDFTMLAWVLTPQSSVGVILSKLEIVNVGGNMRPVGYVFALDQGLPTFQARIPTTINPFLYTGSFLPSVSDGQWHLVAVSVDRDSTTGLRFSVDGVQSPLSQDPTGWQVPIQTSADLFMGRIDPVLSATGSHLTANLDEIQIYKRALSLADIQAIYNAGPAGVCKKGVPQKQSCGVGGTN